MTRPTQSNIDARVLTYYGEQFNEDARLTTRSPQGPLEFLRTQEVIRAHLAHGRVLDVGGGTGQHAMALKADGFEVTLIDPVPQHIAVAKISGLVAEIGDARELPFVDDSFDAVLLLGPLYHLADHRDRRTVLTEARRVTKPGGLIFAAALSRFIAFGAVSLGKLTPAPYPTEWVELVSEGFPPTGLRFPAAHFHTAEELNKEVESAGLTVLELIGVEGPGGLLLELLDDADPAVRDAALTLARAAHALPIARDMSGHLLAVTTVGPKDQL